jgi:hypothetical protein
LGKNWILLIIPIYAKVSSSIKIQDLTAGNIVAPVKDLVIFLSSERINGNQVLQQI